MAFKVVRQTNKIALVGCASSAALLAPGSDRTPETLRAAGLADRLKAVGFEVSDFGDTAIQSFQPDDEHPRARNVSTVLKALNDLRPRVEAAVKSGALPLILCGDSLAAMGAIAAVRRYYRMPSLIYVSREADLQVPATTTDGSVDRMVIAQVTGRGAPELTRFWGEPPLVREPDVTLFGHGLLKPAEEQYLLRSPMRRYSVAEISRMGTAAAARAAVQRIATAKHEFVLHVDLDVLSRDEFHTSNAGEHDGTSVASSDDAASEADGLSISALREALREFARQPTLAAIDIAGYNPALDPAGDGARRLVELLASTLSARFEQETAIDTPAPASVISVSAAGIGGPEMAKSPSGGTQTSGPEDGSPSHGPRV